MTTLTLTTQDTVYQLAAQMMAALPWGAAGDADRARIDKALDLVGSVERMADRPNLFLVTSQSTADTAYQVHQGQCNCPDASRRDARRCKHAVAVELFKQAERADAEQSDPTSEIPECGCTCHSGLRMPCRCKRDGCPTYPVVRVDPEDSILDLWPTEGEHPDLAAQCSQCHAEAASLRHRDGLGVRCITEELWGPDDAA